VAQSDLNGSQRKLCPSDRVAGPASQQIDSPWVAKRRFFWLCPEQFAPHDVFYGSGNWKVLIVGQSLESLPLEQRVVHYRALSDVDFLKAQYADDEQERGRYLDKAAGWHLLAKEMEQIIAHRVDLRIESAGDHRPR
jgi:hypothetical protein